MHPHSQATRPSRNIALVGPTVTPGYYLDAGRLAQVVEWLGGAENCGVQHYPGPSPSEGDFAIIGLGVIALSFVDGQGTQIILANGRYYPVVNLHVRVPQLSHEQLAGLSPEHLWLYQRWEEYLRLHLERLFAKFEVLQLMLRPA